MIASVYISKISITPFLIPFHFGLLRRCRLATNDLPSTAVEQTDRLRGCDRVLGVGMLETRAAEPTHAERKLCLKGSFVAFRDGEVLA